MKKPLPHQQLALKAIRAGLKKSTRGKVIMASGSGKTLVSWWAASEHADHSILALVPSLALARQLYNDWRSKDVWKNGSKHRWLVVCSDPSVTREKGAEDSDDISYEELKAGVGSVTNDAREVHRFLSAQGTEPCVVICTYQSAWLLGEGVPGKFSFDLGIFDEAHKTAGRAGKPFGFALLDKNLRIKKRLFFTATPRRSNYRRLEGVNAEIFHMDDRKIYGETFHELSFMSAMKQGLVLDYDVLIPVIVRADVSRIDILSNRSTALLAKTQVVMTAAKKFGIKKIFSFHGTNDEAEQACQHFDRDAKGFSVYRVEGGQPAEERDNILKRFALEPRAIVTNARCLGEGVNVPVCDAVAFMTPRRSKVDVIQSVGRACRIDRSAGSTKKKAYVVLPIFIEPGETLEEAKRRSAFDDAFDTLNALREHNTVLADDIRNVRERLRNPEAPGPKRVDSGKIKVLVNITHKSGIAGMTAKSFPNAFRVVMAKELRATPDEKMERILYVFKQEARRLGRIK